MDIVCYYIAGLGCSGSKTEKPFIINIIKKELKIDDKNIHFECHKDSSAIKNIGKQLTCQKPLRESNFVNNLTDRIITDLQNNNKVFLLGHSFGGMIVNRTTEQLQKKIIDDTLFSNLSVATFGSIYFAKKKNITKINIFNYVSISDVATICNGLEKKNINELPYILKHARNDNICCKVQEEDTSTPIIQICLYRNNEPICKKNTDISDWDEHTSYSDFMSVLLQNRDLYVFNIPMIYTKHNNTFFILDQEISKPSPSTMNASRRSPSTMNTSHRSPSASKNIFNILSWTKSKTRSNIRAGKKSITKKRYRF